MGRKKKQSVADGDVEAQSDGHFWIAIKKDDVEFLIANLFDSVTNAVSGAPMLSPKPTSKRLLASCNAKKALPLSFAVASCCDTETIRLLLRAGADINARDQTKEQSTALHLACWSEDDPIVELLLESGADLRVGDAEGRTPLHVLASSTADSLVRHILAHASAAPAAGEDSPGFRKIVADPLDLLLLKDKRGATPLHTSAAEVGYGSSALTMALIDHLEAALSAATASGNKSVRRKVDQLLQLGANDSNTVLHSLVSAPEGDAVAIFHVLQRLLKLNANPLTLNCDGQSTFSAAASALQGHKALFTHLFDHVMQCQRNWTEEQQLESLDALFTTLDYEGRPLIHVMISENNIAAVEGVVDSMNKYPLLLANAKPWLGQVVSKDGQTTVRLLATTPASYADEMAALLESVGAFCTDEEDALDVVDNDPDLEPQEEEAYMEEHDVPVEEEAYQDEEPEASTADAQNDEEDEEHHEELAQHRRTPLVEVKVVVDDEQSECSPSASASPLLNHNTIDNSGMSRVQKNRKNRAKARRRGGGGGANGGTNGQHEATTAPAAAPHKVSKKNADKLSSSLKTPFKILGMLLLIMCLIGLYVMVMKTASITA